MGKLEAAIKEYEEIVIPKELSERVNEAIEKSRAFHEYGERKKRRKKGFRLAFSGVAAAAVIFVAGLNTSRTFAAAAEKLPIIGVAARILTFRTYESSDADKTVREEIPGIAVEAVTVEEHDFTDEVNAQIQEKCDAYLSGAIERVSEYKEAFLATGGSEEEFTAKNITIEVGYEIKNQTEETLSFVVTGTESWVSAYAMTEYYNLDLTTLQYLTLEDVLGEDYVAIANELILNEMSRREAADSSSVFWTAAEGGFQTVDEETKFYINAQGQPVVVFDKYEVAPGSMGMVEFVLEPGNASGAEDMPQNTGGDASGGEAEAYRKFAEQIVAAVKAEDMEAFAGMLAYPSYLGIRGGLILESREDFMALDPEEVFAEELKKDLTNVDLDGLEHYEAGITIGAKASVTFDRTGDGTFKITGINY